MPGSHFIDDMMRFLDRRYYVALLSATELHGAAHQAPQVFQVMFDRPLQDRDVGRTRLRFFSAAHATDAPTEHGNVPTGTLRVASKIRPAADRAAAAASQRPRREHDGGEGRGRR